MSYSTMIDVPVRLFETVMMLGIPFRVAHHGSIENSLAEAYTEGKCQELPSQVVRLPEGVIAGAMRELLLQYSSDLDHMSWHGNNGWEFVEYLDMTATLSLKELYETVDKWADDWRDENPDQRGLVNGWQKGPTITIMAFCELGHLVFVSQPSEKTPPGGEL